MGHGPHSSTLVAICVVLLFFVLFYVLFVCKYVLPPGDNPIAVNKYIDIITEEEETIQQYQRKTTFFFLASFWFRIYRQTCYL
jgi:hypothetical protein